MIDTRTALPPTLWIGDLRHHFPADFSAMWGAGRLRGEGKDPYLDALLVDGAPFPRSQFPYGPVVASLFRPLGALDFDTARLAWFALQIAALVALLELGLGAWPRALLAAGALLLASPFVTFPLFAHLERGQVDLLVALGAFASFRLWESGASAAAGAVLMATSVLKLPTLVLFLVPVAALDVPFLKGGLAAAVTAGGMALATDGPQRVARYFRVLLPTFDRCGRLPRELFPHQTPSVPLQSWRERELRVSAFLASNASLTRALRRRFGYRAGTAAGMLALAVTLAVLALAFARAPADGDVRWVAWLAALAAMLLFSPMTWLMGCVHMIVVPLGISSIAALGGPTALVAAALGLASIGSGDVLAPYLPRSVARNRAVLGLVVVWLTLVASLALRALP